MTALPGQWLLATVLLASAASGAAARLDDRAFEQAGFDARSGAELPAGIELVDSRGRPVELDRLTRDLPAVLALAYHDCPNLCGLSIGGLVNGVRDLELLPGRDFRVLVVSFDPSEGPQQAAQARHEALAGQERPGWFFLTGDADNIARLTDAVGFRYAWDAQLEQFAHPSGIVLLTPQGRVSNYLGGVRYAARDLHLALVDAGNGRTGTLGDQLLLLCYRYDPEQGRYGNLVLGALRVAGVLMLLALALYLGRHWWRERRANGGDG